MSRAEYAADRAVLLDLAREVAQCGIPELEERARLALAYVEDDDQEDES
jgi:hypothetical protein